MQYIVILISSVMIFLLSGSLLLLDRSVLSNYALSALAICGFLTIFPWQLSSVVHHVTDEYKARRYAKGLVLSGCDMASGTLFFISALVISLCYDQPMSEVLKNDKDVLDQTLAMATFIGCIVAPLMMSRGMFRFIHILSKVEKDTTDD